MQRVVESSLAVLPFQVDQVAAKSAVKRQDSGCRGGRELLLSSAWWVFLLDGLVDVVLFDHLERFAVLRRLECAMLASGSSGQAVHVVPAAGYMMPESTLDSRVVRRQVVSPYRTAASVAVSMLVRSLPPRGRSEDAAGRRRGMLLRDPARTGGFSTRRIST